MQSIYQEIDKLLHGELVGWSVDYNVKKTWFVSPDGKKYEVIACGCDLMQYLIILYSREESIEIRKKVGGLVTVKRTFYASA
jgi:hypothetical protein